MIKQNIPFSQWTTNQKLIDWVNQIVSLCTPDFLFLCDGSEEEAEKLSSEMVDKKKMIRLNASIRSNSFYCRSDPEDVARVEESTFICTKQQKDVGPTNNWQDPEKMHAHLQKLFSGCMQGRVMYVIPYCMGPLGSSLSHIGIEITDSAYVVLNMRIMTRMGKKVLEVLDNQEFVPGVHSVGVPLSPGQEDVTWPCNPTNRVIAHFPEEKSIWSYGSGYGGNALLGKKCFALRIASVMAKEQGWLAEHMLILGITNPQGEKKYIAAAFPSACGKTNLAMLHPTLPGWKVECVGDDIAWMRIKEDGRLYAINPEAGFFGVAPGTSNKTNPHALTCLDKNCIFTNVALTEDKDIWWEGLTETPPKNLIDWLGKKYIPNQEKPAAHPNSRFTAPASQCPTMDPAWQDPEGVLISAIIFGGRRSQTVPLVYESFSWQHGTFLGASVSSQITAAIKGQVGKLRHDPFAMLAFCGYNMGDYFQHWLNIGKKTEKEKLPKIFYVNWFLKDKKDRFVWPGFGENIRVLKWIFERTNNMDNAEITPIGYIPKISSFALSGLSLSSNEISKLFFIDKQAWLKEADDLEKYFAQFEDNLPKEIIEELGSLRKRLK